MDKNKDSLYRKPLNEVVDFQFDESVARVFDDMIERSVPGYRQLLELLPSITRQFQVAQGNYYDLGCSLGACSFAMAAGLAGVEAQVIGLDTSAAMLKQARQADKTLPKNWAKRQFIKADIRQFDYQTAAMVVLNFTLQFIPLIEREALLKRLFEALQPGGVLILSEKIVWQDTATRQLMTRLHHQFKSDQGYSELEISQKREAIENVLIPESKTFHIQRLQNIGFHPVQSWLQNLQFFSFVAIRP